MIGLSNNLAARKQSLYLWDCQVLPYFKVTSTRKLFFATL